MKKARQSLGLRAVMPDASPTLRLIDAINPLSHLGGPANSRLFTHSILSLLHFGARLLSIARPSVARWHCDNLVTIFCRYAVNCSDTSLPADGFNSL